MSATGFAQLLLNARAAVGFAALQVDLGDLGHQLGSLLSSRAGFALAAKPVVIATGRDFQGFTQRANRVVGFHRVNPLIPLVGGSERMPKVFFKISRCWRRYSFSRRNPAFSASSCSALRFGPPPPSPPGGGGPKRLLQALSRWAWNPNSAATSVAALPLWSHSSTARCLKALSNFRRGLLVWITGSFINVLWFDVFLYLCPPNRRRPPVLKRRRTLPGQTTHMEAATDS